MIPHPRVYTDTLSTEDLERILGDSLRILDEIGMVIQSPEARKRLADVGATIDDEGERVYLSREIATEYLEQTPSQWTLHARNRERSIEIGDGGLFVAPGYGSAFVADANGARRYATMDDFRKFALLAGNSDCVDITGGLLVEPSDVPVELRALEMTRALASLSDKPFMGSVLGEKSALDSIEVARIVMGDLASHPCVLGLININSPLRLDRSMAGAMLQYVKAGQPIILTPGILMGVTAPVTTIGALAQAYAELICCTVLAQVVRPGAPVIVGIGGFASDMRTGGSGFGHPEHALGTLMGAQMARRLGIPFRCTAAVTNSRIPDCQSGYERMMTAMSGWNAGASICLQGAGILDSINSMCYEQFIIDTEIWSYVKRLATPPVVNSETLAFDVIAARPAGYLGEDHTAKLFSRQLLPSSIPSPGSYEDWQASGGDDIVARASSKLDRVIESADQPELPEYVTKHLEQLLDSRRSELR